MIDRYNHQARHKSASLGKARIFTGRYGLGIVT